MTQALHSMIRARTAGNVPLLILDALSVMGLLLVLMLGHIAASDGFAYDAHAYYAAIGYGQPVGGEDTFTYSPVALLAFRAISAVVPWQPFLEVYSLAIAFGVWLLAGPFTLFIAFLPQVASEITLANIHVFLALVAVAGLRWPALWAFAFLTKLTPGIGTLWFVFRGEWRKLAIALGATAVLALPTMVLFPQLWREWVDWLITSATASTVSSGLPLTVRLPTALVLIFVGARRNWSWVVPLACMLALPVLWDVHSLSMLLGVLWYAQRAVVARANGASQVTNISLR